MDFMNRGARPSQQNSNNGSFEPTPGQAEPVRTHEKPKSGKSGGSGRFNFTKVSYVFLTFCVTVLLIGVIVSLVLLKDKDNEKDYVDTSKFQAVFLNNGQVYFGNIKELNKAYLNMENIYYLRVSQQVQPGKQDAANDVSLVKLGCELHGPEDSMVLNRDQVTFWENLKDDGQVVKAVSEYVKANPNGQDCKQQNSATPTTNNGTTPAANTSSTNNDTSTTTENSNSNQ